MARLESALEELRRAWRDALRRPAATAGAAGMLALGIGLTTALFGAIDAVLLRPPPVVDPDRVIVAWTRDITRGYEHFPIGRRAWEAVAYGDPAMLDGVAAVDAWGWSELPAEGAGGARSVRRARVLGDFFGLLGVRPALGRLTTPADALPGEAGYAVLSHGFWMRAFGGSPDVVGRVVRADDRALTVVGVLPPGFDYPRGAELWTPMRPVEDARPQLELDLVARLAAGATRAQATAEIARLLRSDAELERGYGQTQMIVRTLREHLLGDVRPILLVLLAGAALVLVVAIANVANLLLVRGAGRAPQFAIRLALGADRGRLLRQLFAEGAVIGGLGAGLGLAVAWIVLKLLIPLAPADAPGLADATLDLRALGFAAVLAAVVVLSCALVPGIAAARLTPAAVLSGGRRIAGGRARQTLSRRALGAVQIALAVAALAGAHLLVRSFAQLRALELGFEPASLQLIQVAAPYEVFQVPDTYLEAVREVAARLAARGDVLAATPVLSPPLTESGGYAAPVLLEGQMSFAEARDNPLLSIELGLPDYFTTLGIRVVRGRAFDATDGAGGARVLVVNETTARVLWPDRDAVGRRVRLPFPGHEGVEWTVVGVAEDTRYAALLEPRPMLYLPLLQFRSFVPPYLIVRSAPGGSRGLLEATQRAFDELDPRTRVLGASAVPELIDRPLAGPRFAAILLALFAFVAVLLAAAGVYAVLAAAVRERTREFGIRLALGARIADVWRLVLAHGLALAAVGTPVGLLIALAASRRVESLLFGVGPSDPWALAGSAVAIGIVVALACTAPALRAGRVDPAETLRVD